VAVAEVVEAAAPWALQPAVAVVEREGVVLSFHGLSRLRRHLSEQQQRQRIFRPWATRYRLLFPTEAIRLLAIQLQGNVL
jgi:hypothetical protein